MREIQYIESKWHNWHYKNTFLLIISFIAVGLLMDQPPIHTLLESIGKFGYLGAFIAGFMFVSIFTVTPALVVLYYLSQDLNPFLIAIIAGFGGMIGNYLFVHYLKLALFDELKPLIKRLEGKTIRHLFHTPHFHWILPIIGILIIATPISDEIGVSLLGLSNLKTWQFLGLVFVLNVLGILVVVLSTQHF